MAVAQVSNHRRSENLSRARIRTAGPSLSQSLAWKAVANTPGGKYSFLEVSNTGCGIKPEVQDKIFDPFFTTRQLGRGLGLAVVRTHNGVISFQNTAGQAPHFGFFCLGVETLLQERRPSYRSIQKRKNSSYHVPSPCLSSKMRRYCGKPSAQRSEKRILSYRSLKMDLKRSASYGSTSMKLTKLSWISRYWGNKPGGLRKGEAHTT